MNLNGGSAYERVVCPLFWPALYATNESRPGMSSRRREFFYHMIATFTKHLRFARALKSRPYAMVWIGQSLSGLGDGIFYIALAWQVLLMTHSGTAMGIVLVASTIPRLIFMLIGGVTADRLPRRM